MAQPPGSAKWGVVTRWQFTQSVVVRLVACLVGGGIVLSIALSILQLGQAQTLLQMEVTQQSALMARNLQSTIRSLLPGGDAGQLRQALSLYSADARVRGVRLVSPDGVTRSVGLWSEQDTRGAKIWPMPEQGASLGDEVDLQRLTLIRLPILTHDKAWMLEVLIDGPLAAGRLRARVLDALAMQWLLLAMVVLLGLFLVRRWVTGPLADVVDRVKANAGPEPFYALARRSRGEFRQLAAAIAGMLTRIDATAQRLRQREQAFEDLYQFAPAAMLSLDAQGGIVEANRRAADLLALTSERTLIGTRFLDMVRPEDRGLARQTVDRLELESVARCEMRLLAGQQAIDVLVECSGVRDDQGALQQVRVSLLDVSQSKRLQRQVVEKSRLLKLVLDHMSDAILLVDHAGRIAAYNQRLTTMLNRPAAELTGEIYDPAHFWEALSPQQPDLFVARIRQIEADAARAAQDQFATRAGTLRFEGIPAHDAQGQAVGRLWIVTDVSQQDQVQRLLTQQTAQLQAMRQISQRLASVVGLDDLLVRAAAQLYQVMGIEAIGLAIRRDHRGGRSQQIIHRGSAPCLLWANQTLVKAVEQHLMRQVLDQPDVMYWPDPPAGLGWAQAFRQAGLTCVAAIPLRGSSDAQGVFWIARRGGERIERNQIYLLQGLAPVLAARLEFALQRERLQQFRLTDTVTDLPNAQQFNQMMQRLVNRPGYLWSAVLVKIDYFRRLNEMIDHEAADALLRRAAHELQRALRKIAFVARLSGPVFGILCPEMDREQAAGLGRRLRQVMAGLDIGLPDHQVWHVTSSVSVASCPQDGADSEAVMQAVTRRLEAAKAAGGDRLVSEDVPAVSQAG